MCAILIICYKHLSRATYIELKLRSYFLNEQIYSKFLLTITYYNTINLCNANNNNTRGAIC